LSFALRLPGTDPEYYDFEDNREVTGRSVNEIFCGGGGFSGKIPIASLE